MRIPGLLVVATLGGTALASPAAAEPPFDLWAEVLERHTRAVDDEAGVRVDYPAIARSETFARLLDALAATDPDALSGRQAKLAFWINVYNVLAVHVVARSWPVASIRDVGWLLNPVWRQTAGTVGGRTVSLDAVEHEILRPMGEPRIHAAIVCAAESCPDLRREPYRAETLDAQLDDNLRDFLADPRKGLRVEREAGVLRLSPIFDWFAEDFRPPGVVAFLRPYMPDDARAWVEAHPDAELAYFEYDWSVNALSKGP